MFILNKIKKEFSDKLLFENVDLTIYDGERVGIVGSNGMGKSTLMNIMSKKLSPDFGTVEFHGKLAYVQQASDKLCFEDFLTANPFAFQKLKNELNLVGELEQLKQNFSKLSGGEKTKLMISLCLSQEIDTLLLDEPTNNLDMRSVQWLIESINNFNGTVVVISHDRQFLNETVNKIIEVENGNVSEFYGNFDSYEIQKQEQLLFQKREYEKQQVQNKKLEKQIRGLKELTNKLERSSKPDGSADRSSPGYKDSVQAKVKKVARQAEAKVSRLSKLKENSLSRPYEKKDIFYALSEEKIGSKLILKFSDVSKAFGDNLLFEDVNFKIERQDKVALLGDNGTGKTTLLRMILGEEDFDGNIYKASNLKVAYLSQDVFDLDSNLTVFEFAGMYGAEYKTQFLTNLCNMGINRQLFARKISTLSLGERMKIKLNEVILSDFNLLILDEPTNHLDIENKKFLEEVLQKFAGSLIVVSHDQTFVEKVCNRKLLISNKRICEL